MPWLKRAILSEYLVLWLSLAYFCIMALAVPGFAGGTNLREILSNMLPLLVVAFGQTLVLIAGGIDLSVSSVIALASVTGAKLMTGEGGWMQAHPMAPYAGAAVMLLSGVTVGLINGVSVAHLAMPPFMVTLTTMMFFSGLAIWSTQSANIYDLPDTFLIVGGNLYSSLAVVLSLGLGIHIILNRSLYGRWLYITGRNPEMAHIIGVPVKRVLTAAYIACSVCAATGAILYTGRLETGSPTMGSKLLLDIIGATVIGGTSLFGGVGKILWTVFGVLFLTLVDNSLLLLNMSPFTIMVVKGAIILLAALLDTWRRRLRLRERLA